MKHFLIATGVVFSAFSTFAQSSETSSLQAELLTPAPINLGSSAVIRLTFAVPGLVNYGAFIGGDYEPPQYGPWSSEYGNPGIWVEERDVWGYETLSNLQFHLNGGESVAVRGVNTLSISREQESYGDIYKQTVDITFSRLVSSSMSLIPSVSWSSVVEAGSGEYIRSRSCWSVGDYSEAYQCDSEWGAAQYTGTSGYSIASHYSVFANAVNVQAVPEPSRWLTMVAGIGVLGFALTRRKRFNE